MEQIRLLLDMTGRTAPGRMPDYTTAHLLYALSILNENTVGRKQLSTLLRVGEGTVRTIISRLSEEGLISISRSGITLSDEGASFFSLINEKITWTKYPSTDITVADVNCLVLIRDSSDKVRFGVEQRDHALIHGAVGATTLLNKGGSWVMPGQDVVVDLVVDMESGDGDVVIIGSGVDEFSARLGALSAAMYLLV